MLKIILYISLLSNYLYGIDIIIDKTSKLNIMDDVNSVLDKGSSKNFVAMDIVNGLLRDNKKEVLTDIETGRMWQDNKGTEKVILSWKEAKAYCKNLTHAGKSNWYLPSIGELESIVDYTKDSPAVKEGFVNTANRFYWSSSSSVVKPQTAWNINFEDGGSRYKAKDRKFNVRCVRRGQK